MNKVVQMKKYYKINVEDLFNLDFYGIKKILIVLLISKIFLD